MKLMLAETPEDIAALAPLVRQWGATCCEEEHGLPIVSVDVMLQRLNQISKSNGCVLVLTGARGALGVMAAVPAGNVMIERFLYMINFQFMPRLVNGMKKYSRAQGCKTLVFTSSNISSDKRDRVARLFAVHGVREYSRTYTVGCG